MHFISRIPVLFLMLFVALAWIGCSDDDDNDSTPPVDDDTTEITEDITEDMTLTDINTTPGEPDYCIRGNIVVDALLTIDPGVEIAFAADASLQVSSDGVLIAEGTAENPIILTAKNPSEPWRGLAFVLSDDFRNSLDYVEISYAGSDIISIIERTANLSIGSFSQVSVTNTTVSNSSSFGMYIEEEVELSEFANNTFENNEGLPLALPAENVGILDAASEFNNGNGDNRIEIYGGEINVDESTTWTSFNDGTEYLITDNIGIKSELEILPGSIFNVEPDLSIVISGDLAVFIANGTATEPITFRAADANFNWRGIAFILADDVRNTLNYVEISGAGADIISIADRNGGLVASSFSRFSLTNSTIIDNEGDGMFIDDDVVLTSFGNNRFENNTGHPVVLPADQIGALDPESTYSLSNGDNTIEVFGSVVDLDEETTWNAFNDGTPYFISGNIDINTGVVIAPSARFLFDSNLRLSVNANGYLSAIANSVADQITFTALNPNLPWRGIGFATDDVRNELNFVEVSYGSSDVISIANEPANIYVNPFDELTINNCTITNSAGYGLYTTGSATVNGGNSEAVVLNANTFDNNELGDVFIED